MEYVDWESRWTSGQIGFHQADISHALDAHTERVWPEGRIGRVYVPLCGKTHDLAYLAERSDEVVGVEFVEQAVLEFFAEHRLDASFEPGPPRRHHAANLTLYAADFFDIEADTLGVVDSVFDRAALVALDAETRRRYAIHLTSLLPPGARMLLVTFDYDQTEMQGPPFAVATSEVEQLYGDAFDIEHLETREVLNDRMAARGLSAMTESNWLLTRRG